MTLGPEENLHPGDEIVNVRDMRENVIAEEEISLPPSATSLRASFTPKNSVTEGIPFLIAFAQRFSPARFLHGNVFLDGNTAEGNHRYWPTR